MKPYTPMRMLRPLWRQLRDIPVDNEGHIEMPFLHFCKGTDREDIWHWFEGKNPRFIVGKEMYSLKNKGGRA